MKTQHTPTPWKIVDGMLKSEFYIMTDRETYVVEFHDDTPQNRANAAFIVRAVNAYEKDQEIKEELVAQLKKALECLHGLNEFDKGPMLKAIAKSEAE